MSSTVLDAGYFNVSQQAQEVMADLHFLYVRDTAYLLELKQGATLSPENIQHLKAHGEMETFDDTSHPPKSYVLFRKNHSDVATELSSEAVEKITYLNFAPKPTEQMTLEYGLQQYGKEVAQVSIMVDDLGLPSGLNNHLSLLLPESYRALLADNNFLKPIVLSERVSRNKGFNTIERKRSDPKSHFQVITGDEKPEVVDCSTGSCSATSNSSSYLVSDSIKRVSSGARGCGGVTDAVALSKPGNKMDGKEAREVPSCGVIVAGQIKQIIDNGYDRVIMVYHRKDDKDMHRKIMDGCAIAAWLWPKSDLVCRSVQLMSSPESMQQKKSQSLSALPFVTTKAYSLKEFNEGSDLRLYDELLSGRGG